MTKYLFKTEPYAHQVQALRASWDHPHFALFAEMGLGKTKMMIDTVGALFENGKVDGLLVTAPKGTYRIWIDEVALHLPDRIERQVALWSVNMRKDEQKAYAQMQEISDGLHILVVNTEALSTAKGCVAIRQFLNSHRAVWVMDESTKIKNHRAARTKMALRLAPQAHYRRILSGLPNPQGPLDLFSQAEFLEPGLFGTSNFFAFRNRYALMRPMRVGPRNIQIVTGYTNLDDLSERLARFSMRMRKEDCLDLPPKVYTRRVYQLPKEHRALYDRLRKEALIEIESGGELTVTLAITLLMKLHQIACGHVRLDDGTVLDLSGARLEVLDDLIEEAGASKVLIWATYKHDVEKVARHLAEQHGDEAVATYYGPTPAAKRHENVQRFQDPANPLRYLVCSEAAAFGLTLTQASVVIYYSNTYNLETRVQSEDRPHRIGQQKSVTYVDIVAENTVDAKICKALASKLNLAKLIIDTDPGNWL